MSPFILMGTLAHMISAFLPVVDFFSSYLWCTDIAIKVHHHQHSYEQNDWWL